jgi:hypothetical protein
LRGRAPKHVETHVQQTTVLGITLRQRGHRSHLHGVDKQEWLRRLDRVQHLAQLLYVGG